ncbi:hypothetical protein YTPLAS21_19420 [Candidatus Nitrosocosmicus sp.]|nr:hypothetical protein YTPLAS21_19420 [Candidatus Nitrosocosmicus sp.]
MAEYKKQNLVTKLLQVIHDYLTVRDCTDDKFNQVKAREEIYDILTFVKQQADNEINEYFKGKK